MTPRSPASAMAMELGGRHRWGLIAVVTYLLVLAACRLLIPEPVARIDSGDAWSFALRIAVPLTSTFLYFLAVFSFGLTGDLAARQSMFPARMFTLPVSAAALAGWPMLFGATAMAILWIAVRWLAVWPSDVEVPVVWPALLAASLVAWTQALTWMAYPLRGLRVIVTVLWLTAIDAIIMVALELKAPEPVMLAILAPHVPLAWLVARFAVGRARRGDVPDWRAPFAPFAGLADALVRRRHFGSAARAQAWFEWGICGWPLPLWVALLLPFELSLLFVFRDTPVLVFETLLSVLFTPPFMASFVAAAGGRSGDGKERYGLSPFLATRPMTTAALVAAKLKAMVWSTLAAWIPLLLAVPLALRLSGTAPLAADWMGNLAHAVGWPRAIGLVLLGLAMLMLSTWKQLVQSLFITLSGRAWVVKGSVFLALILLGVLVPLAHRVFHSRVALAALWNLFPWILGLAVCVKLSAAAWIARRLQSARLLTPRALVLGAACWDLAVFALFGLMVWLTPALLVFRYFLALVAIAVIPLVRLSAAPLALAWNRHRP